MENQARNERLQNANDRVSLRGYFPMSRLTYRTSPTYTHENSQVQTDSLTIGTHILTQTFMNMRSSVYSRKYWYVWWKSNPVKLPRESRRHRPV